MIGLRARQGAYSERYHAPVTVAGLYWHFVDVVWIFLFALIYLPGRARMTKWHPPRALLLAWIGLLALLGLTVAGAYQPFGAYNTVLALADRARQGADRRRDFHGASPRPSSDSGLCRRGLLLAWRSCSGWRSPII